MSKEFGRVKSENCRRRDESTKSSGLENKKSVVRACQMARLSLVLKDGEKMEDGELGSCGSQR